MAFSFLWIHFRLFVAILFGYLWRFYSVVCREATAIVIVTPPFRSAWLPSTFAWVKTMLNYNFATTFGYFWLLSTTKRYLRNRIFVSGKQDEPKGCLPQFVQISRTTHSDYLNTPIGIIWTRHRDYPDSMKRLFERRVVDPSLLPRLPQNCKL